MYVSKKEKNVIKVYLNDILFVHKKNSNVCSLQI